MHSVLWDMELKELLSMKSFQSLNSTESIALQTPWIFVSITFQFFRYFRLFCVYYLRINLWWKNYFEKLYVSDGFWQINSEFWTNAMNKGVRALHITICIMQHNIATASTKHHSPWNKVDTKSELTPTLRFIPICHSSVGDFEICLNLGSVQNDLQENADCTLHILIDSFSIPWTFVCIAFNLRYFHEFRLIFYFGFSKHFNTDFENLTQKLIVRQTCWNNAMFLLAQSLIYCLWKLNEKGQQKIRINMFVV